MLRKQKIIRIKDPRLRAVRLGLREVLLNVYYNQKAVLQAIWLGAEGDDQLSLLRKIWLKIYF